MDYGNRKGIKEGLTLSYGIFAIVLVFIMEVLVAYEICHVQRATLKSR